MTVKIVNILFENFNIKGEWDENLNEYYFPVLDAISKIIDTPNPKAYWENIKKTENNLITSKFSSENIEEVSLKDFFRIAMLIQSPEANQIRIWLAGIGASRINDEVNP